MNVSDCFNVAGKPEAKDLLLAEFVVSAPDAKLFAALVQRGKAGDPYAAHLLGRICSGNNVAIRARLTDTPNSGVVTVDRCDIAEHFVDQKDAFKWIEMAAQSGNAEDVCALAWCYGRGIGCTRDLHRSLELLIQAAACATRNGEAVGMGYACAIGALLDSDTGFTESLARGVRLIKEIRSATAGRESPAPAVDKVEDYRPC